MRIAAVLTVFALVATPAATQTLTPPQQYARDVYKEIIEFNSVNIGGGTTEVANALAKRFRDAGFAEQDIFLGGSQPNKHNIVVRYHGKGGPNAPKPLLLLAHLDVVEALKADWSPICVSFAGHTSESHPTRTIAANASRTAILFI